MYENVIIVPYRDRPHQLNEFRAVVAPLLLKHLDNTKIVVIEQDQGKPFNRGKLLNVGCKEYLNSAKYIITHDIDMIPCIDIICTDYTKQLPIYSIYAAHKASLGGITKLSTDTLRAVNGFPNDIWGWGIEDRALYYRCKIASIPIERKFIGAGCRKGYKLMPHKSNAHEYSGVKKQQSDIWKREHIVSLSLDEKHSLLLDGINTVGYDVLERCCDDNIEHIKVKI